MLALLPDDCQVTVSTTTKDLGVGTALGAKRTTKVQQGRLAKMSNRLARTTGLVKVHKQCRKMVWVGAKPQGTWGHQGQGLAPTTLTKLRQAFAKTGMLRKPGGCTTTAYAITVGAGKDPAISLRIELIQAWCDTITHDPAQRAAICKTWDLLRQTLDDRGPTRWNAVAGPTAAVIATLMDIGWGPLHHTCERTQTTNTGASTRGHRAGITA